MVKLIRRRPQRAYLLPVVFAAVLLVVAVVGQVSHPTKAVGHDTWTIMPVREWSFAVGNRAGFWDGVDPKTHQDTSGRIYVYGFVGRWTNTQ